MSSGTNELEQHLLTRCYDSSHEILQLLELRYSATGDQKSTILLKRGTPSSQTQKKLNLLQPSTTTGHPPSTSLSNSSSSSFRRDLLKRRKQSTRVDLKQYISQTLKSQRKLTKKIQHLQRQNVKFNLNHLLRTYNIPQFESFLHMNSLWQSYIQSLLTYDGKFQLQISQIVSRLVNADFNGCFITVLQSRNTNLVGTRGIIVWDAQHLFIIVAPQGNQSKEWFSSLDDKGNEQPERNRKNKISASDLVSGFKAIPKQHTMFGFDIIVPRDKRKVGGTQSHHDINVDQANKDQTEEKEPEQQETIPFTMIGSRFEIRSIDRSSKKFKNHSVDNIL